MFIFTRCGHCVFQIINSNIERNFRIYHYHLLLNKINVDTTLCNLKFPYLRTSLEPINIECNMYIVTSITMKKTVSGAAI